MTASSALAIVQDLLLDNLQHLLDAAISADAPEKKAVVHELVCKVEEVHVTLQKHLRKEEEQLFPLVLKHFTFEEQADLVVPCISIAACPQRSLLSS